MNDTELPDDVRRLGETIATDITGSCARCGGQHEGLSFRPLSRPTDWTHWAPCPENGEPIMLKIAVPNDAN